VPPLAARLQRVFEATEEENRREILAALPEQPGSTLADLGCGDGEFTMRAAQRVRAARVIGVETAASLIPSARERGVEIVESDLGQPLPFGDGEIDVVVSNQVIEHLSDTDLFMREIRRVLAPGGVAVLSTNNLASWHNVAALVAGWQPMPCHVSDEVTLGNPASFAEGFTYDAYPMHRRVFTGRALAGLAAHHGLAVDGQASAGYYPLPPRAARLATRLDARHGAFLVQRYRRAA
jgi:ubiquinone/menaquinone biosynthesis C-methylase UbiE